MCVCMYVWAASVLHTIFSLCLGRLSMSTLQCVLHSAADYASSTVRLAARASGTRLGDWSK